MANVSLFSMKNAVLIVMRPFLPTYNSVAAENVLILVLLVILFIRESGASIRN